MTELRFREDGTFTIVQFTDLHFTDLKELDQKTSGVMEGVLEAEKPDLVVFTGDVISGGDTPYPASSLRFALEPVTRRNLPFATPSATTTTRDP